MRALQAEGKRILFHGCGFGLEGKAISLKLVWRPLQIGSVTLKNRVAQASHSSSGHLTGSITDDLIKYHEVRARGGVGLTVLQAGAVHPNSRVSYVIDDSIMPGFERLMTAVRPYDMRVFQQLWHGGHHYPGVGGAMPWAPSATPSTVTGIVGVPMIQADIDELVAAFGSAARRCRDAGLDGVEVQAGHGYLIHQFLSPLTNRRSDGYNGGLLDRARFLIEVLRRVRADVGPGFPVGVRAGLSTAIGGTSAHDIATVATHLEEEGLIDFLDITYGDYFRHFAITPTMAFPTGYQIPFNEPISRAVKVPRLVTGRYRTLEEAEQQLREGQADLVSLVRAQIADPDLVRKTREGRVEDVRPCIACNQGCVGGLVNLGRMQCTVNPAAGYELALAEDSIGRADKPKRIMIVGGGPSGLEAARVSALRGHRVILAEAKPELGGMLQVAKRAPNLQTLGDILDWLERQVFSLGVDVRRSAYIDANDVLAENPDVLLVATGAMVAGDGRQAMIPGELPAGMDLPHVFDPESLIMADCHALRGKSAVVFDDVGHYDGIACAEFLARASVSVVYVTSLGSFAPKMFGTFRDIESLRRLNQGEFRLLVNYQLVAIERDAVLVVPVGSDRAERIAADLAVVVTNPTPMRDLFDQLRDQIADIHLIGNALSPRDLLAAIHDGHRTARAI